MSGCRQFVAMGNAIRDAMAVSLEVWPDGRQHVTRAGCERLASELQRRGVRVFRAGRNSMGAWQQPLSWMTNEGGGALDPWQGWVEIGGTRFPLGAIVNMQQLAVCQGFCPQGWIPGVPWWKGTCSLPSCPWMCRGCQAGWPFDAAGRHIGPVRWPAANRWDCNRVKWLGAGAFPGSQLPQEEQVPFVGPWQRGPDRQELYPRWVG